MPETPLSLFHLAGSPPPSQSHSPTSVAAAESIRPHVNALQAKALEAFRGAKDGLTDEEGQDASGMTGSTWRPRRIELVSLGLVRDSGKTRKVRSGREAVVWIVAEAPA